MAIGGSDDADDPRWLLARDAARACQQLFGNGAVDARQRLIELAADDIVRTWCNLWVSRSLDGWDVTESYSDNEIVPAFWQRLRQSRGVADWFHGVFTATTLDNESRAHGVRFSGTDLALYKRNLDRPPIDDRIRAADAAVAAQASDAKLAAIARTMAAQPGSSATRRLLAKPPPKKRASPGTRSKRPVSPAEFDAWFAEQPLAAQALGYRRILANAKSHFRRPVARKLAEEMAKGRGPGRKPAR